MIIKTQNKLKFTILSLSLITVMSGAAASPALGAIAQYFSEANPLLVKLIITLPSLFIILTSLLFSQLANKVSTKKIAILGLILYLSGGCLAGLAANIYQLLFFRILLGIGVGLIMPLSTGLISYLFAKNEQSKLMGFSSAMNNIGGVIALAISGILVSFNWRFSFGVYLLGLFVLILVVLFLPAIKIENSTSTKLTVKDLKKAAPYLAAMFLFMLIFYALPTNFSIIMTSEQLVSTSLIGVLMSIQNLSAFLTGIILAKLLKLFAQNTGYLAVFILAVGYLILGITTNINLIILALILLGGGLGIIVPYLNSQISLFIVKEKTPAIMALMSAMLYLGQFLSPLVIALIINILKLHNNIRAPFYIAAILSLGLGFFFLKIPFKVEN